MGKEILLKVDASAKLATTPEGYLIVPAFATRSGVFDYRDEEGKIRREFRPSEEVFDQASMDSLKLKPVTRQHKGGIITADNIKQFQKGTTGEVVERVVTQDGEFLGVTVLITDKAEIANIQSRRNSGAEVELSAGYTDKTIAIQGTHPTEGKYDAIQTDIRYNHLSIVDKGRAGPHATLKLDDEPNKEKQRMGLFSKPKQKAGSVFHMDAMGQVEVPDEAMSTIRHLDSKLDEAILIIGVQAEDAATAQGKTDAIQAEFDQLKTDHDKLKADHEAVMAPGSPLVKKMVEDQAKVTTVATALGVTMKKDDGTDKTAVELRLDCIMASDKDFVADGKSEEYMAARFDAIAIAPKHDHTSHLGMAAVHVAAAAVKKDAAASGDKLEPRDQFIKDSADFAAGKKKEG